MQIKLFTISIADNGAAQEEMNRFLRGHKVLEVEKQLISNEHGAQWCFCVSYIENSPPPQGKKEKTDYKNLLKPEEFEVFSILRKVRKALSEADGVPAYAVFTDEELAGIARTDEITLENIQKIKGIGTKKIEKYGEKILNGYKKLTTNEKNGQPG